MQDIEELFEEMYKFENDKRLYAFRFKDTGLPMWMFVRACFIRAVTDQRMDNQYTKIFHENYYAKQFLKKGMVNRYITRNPFFSRRKDVVFAGWSYHLLRQHRDGLVYEDLIMPFLRIHPKYTTVLMTGEISNNYELDCLYPNWKMDDILKELLNHKIIGKTKQGISIEDRKSIKGLILFLSHNCPLAYDDSLKKKIISMLEGFSCYSKRMIQICVSYLKIVKPKVMVISEASYMDILRTSLVLACKREKVITAELQHGFVGRYHPYYCFGDYILNNKECSQMLPDYFLTYGKYWNNKIKIPQKCEVVGYAQPLLQNSVPINNKILICADIRYEIYVEFLNIVMHRFSKGTEVYFRPHPIYSTSKQMNMIKKFVKYPNFFMADAESLSFYLNKCRYVITDCSTVSFEALYMGRIVFSFMPENILTQIQDIPSIHVFDSADEFMSLWNNRDKLKPEYHNEFFDLNYEENYKKFLRKCGVSLV